jgi:hypothetical protein
VQQFKADRQQMGATTVGEEAEVTDANEAAWEQMQQEAPQELVCRQAHQLLLVAMGGVAPTERDSVIGKVDQSVVGDRDTMCVSAEIAQDMLGASEGRLAYTIQSWRNSVRNHAAKRRGSARCKRLWWNRSDPSLNAAFSPATNLPRNTRLSTLMGRKKRRLELIQRA